MFISHLRQFGIMYYLFEIEISKERAETKSSLRIIQITFEVFEQNKVRCYWLMNLAVRSWQNPSGNYELYNLESQQTQSIYCITMFY